MRRGTAVVTLSEDVTDDVLKTQWKPKTTL